MSQHHPYRSLELPIDAPFELRPSPGKGWGVFARGPIQKDSLILSEKPLFLIQKPPSQITEGDIRAALQNLPPHERQRFLLLRDNTSRPFTHALRAFSENCFRFENTAKGPTDKSSASGFCPLHSRFNHSCTPNSNTERSEAKVESFAIKDILGGEEIAFCYNEDLVFLRKHERLQDLIFACSCKACRNENPLEQQLSDMRRRLIRGLYYLTFGADRNSDKNGTQSLIIFDPTLRQAAKEFRLSLSKSFVHLLLMAALAEEEGVLGMVVKSHNYELFAKIMCSCFENESNARIAKLAIAKETWQRNCV